VLHAVLEKKLLPENQRRAAEQTAGKVAIFYVVRRVMRRTGKTHLG